MTEQTITIYCFIDDFFRAIGRKDDAHCKINDAEVLTTALLAARYFHGNLHSACCYMKEHHGVKMIDKSGFTRRLHGLKEQLLALFAALGRSIKQLNTSCRYLIDSFPVSVCDNIRIARSHLLQGEAYRGKCVSKRCYFYGFRVQVITTTANARKSRTWLFSKSITQSASRPPSLALPTSSQRKYTPSHHKALSSN